MAKQRIAKNGQKKKTQNKGITAISVCGFKSLSKESRIEIRPLTILAGANSSGKSSIMQPLLLLKQTLEASYDPGPLLLDGPNVQFISADQVFSFRSRSPKSRSFDVKIETIYDFCGLSYEYSPSEGIKISRVVLKGADKTEIVLYPDMESKKIDNLFHIDYWEMPLFFPKTKKGSTVQWKIIRDRGFLYPELKSKNDSILILPGNYLTEDISQLMHLPGLRGNPERAYVRTAIGAGFPGTFEIYTASIIAHWQNKKDERIKILEQMLIHLGLTWKISAKTINDTQVELQVGRLPKISKGGARDLVNIADVGFGVSQILPVLVALLVAEKGQLVYIEQPELHLHPKAQYFLAEILAGAAKRGVRLVIETHSILLLRRVQTLVAEGVLDPEIVKLHWFSRNPEDGMTEIQSTDLDKNGAFGDWPEDFGDVELMAEGAYLDAVEKRNRN